MTLQGGKLGTLHTAFLHFFSKWKSYSVPGQRPSRQSSNLHRVEVDAYLLKKCCWMKERLFGWCGARRERRKLLSGTWVQERQGWGVFELPVSRLRWALVGRRKSRRVKPGTAGMLRGLLLRVTDYSWEKRARKLPSFNDVRAEVGIRLWFRLKGISFRELLTFCWRALFLFSSMTQHVQFLPASLNSLKFSRLLCKLS